MSDFDHLEECRAEEAFAKSVVNAYTRAGFREGDLVAVANRADSKTVHASRLTYVPRARADLGLTPWWLLVGSSLIWPLVWRKGEEVNCKACLGKMEKEGLRLAEPKAAPAPLESAKPRAMTVSAAGQDLIGKARSRRLQAQERLEAWIEVPGFEWVREAVGELLQAHGEELATVVERSDRPTRTGAGFWAKLIREYIRY